MKKPGRRARRDAAPERVVPAWTRLAVTLGVPLVVEAAAPLLGLPGIEPHALKTGVSINVFSLRLMPYVWAAIAVELIVASLGRGDLRNGSGRKKLATYTVALALVIALAQGHELARTLQSIAAAPTGLATLATMTVTLAAGTVVLALAADGMTRFGLGSGYAILAMVESLVLASHNMLAEPPLAATLPRALAAVAATAGVTWWVLRGEKPVARTGLAGAAYRAPSTPPAQLDRIRAMAPGGAILALVLVDHYALELQLSSAAPAWLVHAALDPPTEAAIELALVASLSAAFAWLSFRPKRVAAVAKAAGAAASLSELEADARAALVRATATTCLYAVAIFAIGCAGARYASTLIVFAGALPTALALDVAAEWRARRRTPDLVAVWCDQRPYAMPAARAVLTEAGIEAFVRAERLRRLLPLVAPFAPLEILVPAKDAARAGELLAVALGARAKTPPLSDDDADESAPEVAPRAKAARPWRLIAMTAALGVATIAIAYARREPPKPPRQIRADAIEFLPVDDAEDAFMRATLGLPLPSNAKLEIENTPIGPEKTAPRQYVRWTAAQGETPAETRAAFMTWVSRGASRALRVLPGPLYEYDEEHERDELVGVRSWVVGSQPIVAGVGVAEARTSFADSKEWVVDVKLTPDGAARFGAYTRDHLGQRLAIVVDGEVVSAPRIRSEVSGGSVQITMGARVDPEQQRLEAERLVDAMTVPAAAR